MRISDWSSDVCSSDLLAANAFGLHHLDRGGSARHHDGHRNAKPRAVIAQPLRMVAGRCCDHTACALFFIEVQQRIERAALLVGGGELQVLELQPDFSAGNLRKRSEEHTSELQSLMLISYAVFC